MKTNPGRQFEQLVARIRKAISPDAEIVVRAYYDGPDGRREIDVAETFPNANDSQIVMIECKDWTRPVTIETLDALASKSEDLQAKAVMLYSRSGFSEAAIHKARRLGIHCMIPMATDPKAGRIKVFERIPAKRVSQGKATIIFVYQDDQVNFLPENLQINAITFDEKPVGNLFYLMSMECMEVFRDSTDIGMSCEIEYRCLLDTSVCKWRHGTTSLPIKGIRLLSSYTKDWVYTETPVELSLGHFDVICNTYVLPNGESVTYQISSDPELWVIDEEHRFEANPKDGFALKMELFITVFPDIPDVDINPNHIGLVEAGIYTNAGLYKIRQQDGAPEPPEECPGDL